MRRLLLFVTYLSLSVVLFAEPVSKKQAQQIASQFLSARSASHRAPAATELKTEVVFDAVDEAGQPYLYAVKGQHEGFVLVSGDDRFCQVLGYSHSGTLDLQDMPDNMRAWLQGYVDEMKHLKTVGYQPSATTAARRTSAIKTAITPLIQTTWNQGAPYNNKCPLFVNGARSVTGCVATAMAQIMYFQAMENGLTSTTLTQQIDGYTCEDKYNVAGETKSVQVEAVPANTEIAWDKMATSYTSSSAGESADAVALLMQCCGTSVKMEYHDEVNGGSSASSYDAVQAMKTYFGYASTAQYIQRRDYSYAEWIDILYQELQDRRPVLFDGQSVDGGHAFVVDGYDQDDYFHVNWGWGGKSDGFYRVVLMNPKDQGVGGSSSNSAYTMSQGMGIGLALGSGETPVAEPAALTVTSATLYVDDARKSESASSSILYGNGYDFVPNISVQNLSGSTHTFSCGLRLTKEDGTFIKDYDWLNIEQLGNGYTYSAYGSCMLNPNEVSELVAGNYKVTVICKESSSDTWQECLDSEKHYFLITINSNNTMNATAYNVASPAVELTCNSVSFSSENAVVNESYQITLNVTNSGTKDYHGDVVMRLTGYSNILAGINCDIAVGQTKDLVLAYTPTSTGVTGVTITADETETKLYTGTITVIDPGASSSVNVTTTDATLNNDGNAIYGNSMKVKFSVTNNSSDAYKNGVKVVLYRVTSESGGYIYSTEDATQSDSREIAAGENKEYEFAFNDLTYGERYKVLYGYIDASGNFQSAQTSFYTIAYGIVTIDAEGNVTGAAPATTFEVPDGVAAVDLRGLATLPAITKNSNPNCLYFVDEGKTLNGITDNVVAGGVAENIVLEDNENGFYTPVSFKANTISYSRTESVYGVKGTSEGWTTLVLPFAAEGVKTVLNGSDYQLTWFTSGSDTNKNLWLMEFGDEVNSVVEFSYVQTLEANKPYIMALPGDTYGNKWSLVGLPIIFYATNADITANAKAVTTGTNYKFVGTTVSTGEQQDIYALNAKGDSFEKGTATVQPFRAYFAPTTTYATAASLVIGFGDSAATGINVMESTTKQQEGVFYNLNGQRVAQPAKGLYIVNGKKVIIK